MLCKIITISLLLIVGINCEKNFRGTSCNQDFVDDVWVTRSNDKVRTRYEDLKEIGRLPLRDNEFPDEHLNFLLGIISLFYYNIFLFLCSFSYFI